MGFEYSNTKADSFFGLSDNLKKDERMLMLKPNLVRILWNRNSKPLHLLIDGLPFELKPNQLATTTFLHHIAFHEKSLPVTAFLFNREFYCLFDHDKEVSCNGILFFGAQNVPVITVQQEHAQKFESLYAIFIDEFNTCDQIQGDMLQMLLKRLIIICTRMAKEQLGLQKTDPAKADLVRQFNFLVDLHFKNKKQVSDYASLLNKSPKTLANLFLLSNQKTPQQIIHERIALEAKRLLQFSEKNSKEIAYALGFDEPAHFSKFFKKIVGASPTEYREKALG